MTSFAGSVCAATDARVSAMVARQLKQGMTTDTDPDFMPQATNFSIQPRDR
jgi:hypothetical protein